MDFDTWKKTSNYSLDKSKFSSLREILGFFVFCTNIFTFFPYGFFPNGVQVQKWNFDLVYLLFVLFSHCNFKIPSLPLDWYQQFNSRKNMLQINPQSNFGLVIKLKVLYSDSVSVLSFYQSSHFYLEKFQNLPNYWWVISFIVFFGIQLLLMIIWPKVILHF